MQIDTEHPLLFLSDAVPNFDVPPDTSAAFALATRNCLTFWVLSYVDGATRVTIADQPCPNGGRKLFSGSIMSLTGTLTISDSSNFRYLNLPVPEGEVGIRLWAEDDRHPEWVWIELGEIRSI